MKRFSGLSLAVVFALIALYLSRFWMFSLWGSEGLFGLKALSPAGGLLGRWLRGTDFLPFELLIWAVFLFLGLTYLQRGFDKIFKA